jgi:hypothetical protein
MTEKPKSLFQKAVDALKGDQTPKTAAAPSKPVASVGTKEKDTAAKTAADKAAADKMLKEQQEAARKRAEAMAAPKKGKVTVRSLHIRADHDAKSAEVGGLVKDQEVTWTETWTDGTNTWVKLGDGKWAAMVYKGETYIKAG